ncbi:MAG TPA: PmoA family protein [Chthonomonadaceae bacterium]|nr:PmoA family protein [Chthonomonadaceae bacterium]
MPSETTITVHAGPHDRANCPVRLKLPRPLPEGTWELAAEDGVTVPMQALGVEAAYVETGLKAGESRKYRLRQRAQGGRQPAIQMQHTEGRDLAVLLRGELLTRYTYGDVPARPYFYPVMSPLGVCVTRNYPMRTDVPGEMKDHPHHRSLYIAFGEVNGTDNWSEEKGHGFTLPQSIQQVESGDVLGRFAATSLWATQDKKPLLTEHLVFTVWATDDTTRLLDFDIRLEATHGDVHFGDTKEGGILSTRVASSMDVPRGGKIENVYGGINEGETWGKAAHWCDYSGEVEGKAVGIAILDHPLSFRYPTHWHVRDYGLMTANPFGYSYYTNGVKNGSHNLPAGESLEFHYRVVLHEGDAKQGQVNAHYLNFAAPPRVEVG